MSQVSYDVISDFKEKHSVIIIETESHTEFEELSDILLADDIYELSSSRCGCSTDTIHRKDPHGDTTKIELVHHTFYQGMFKLNNKT